MIRAIVCPPRYFQVKYSINPWMDNQIPVDSTLAASQHHQLVTAYRNLGLTVQKIKPVVNLPDMVFAANYGVVLGQKFIPANFVHPVRQPEAGAAAEYFRQIFDLEVVYLPKEVAFEGQGDLLAAADCYFLGWGQRTLLSAKLCLEPYVDRPIIALELISPWFYHLDTCLAPLSKQAVLINPAAFRPRDIAKIRAHFPIVIETRTDENRTLPCNLVQIGQTVVVASGFPVRLRSELAALGLDLAEVPMSEFIKSGGSVKCLTFLLDQSA